MREQTEGKSEINCGGGWSRVCWYWWSGRVGGGLLMPMSPHSSTSSSGQHVLFLKSWRHSTVYNRVYYICLGQGCFTYQVQVKHGNVFKARWRSLGSFKGTKRGSIIYRYWMKKIKMSLFPTGVITMSYYYSVHLVLIGESNSLF